MVSVWGWVSLKADGYSNLTRLKKECIEERTSNGSSLLGVKLLERNLLRIACDRLKDPSKVRMGVHAKALAGAHVVAKAVTKAQHKDSSQIRKEVVKQSDRACKKIDGLRHDLGPVFNNPQAFANVAERELQKEYTKATKACDVATTAKHTATAAAPNKQAALHVSHGHKLSKAVAAVRSFGLQYACEVAAPLREKLQVKLRECGEVGDDAGAASSV